MNSAATTSQPTSLSTPTPTDDQIDDYIAKLYVAQMGGKDPGTFTSRLLAMSEEARLIDVSGQVLFQKMAREMAAWELANQ